MGSVIKEVEFFSQNYTEKQNRMEPVGSGTIHDDYTVSLNVPDPGIREKLESAFDASRAADTASLHYCDQGPGGEMIRYGKELGPGDKDYIYAFIDAAQQGCNYNSSGEIIYIYDKGFYVPGPAEPADSDIV